VALGCLPGFQQCTSCRKISAELDTATLFPFQKVRFQQVDQQLSRNYLSNSGIVAATDQA
jgi:hypothetical protein